MDRQQNRATKEGAGVTEMQKMDYKWTPSDLAGLSNVPFRLIAELRDSREELLPSLF